MLNLLRKQYKKRGFQEVITPNIFKLKLWETSGHLEHYEKNLFIIPNGEESLEKSNERFALKPMNCPGHCLFFKKKFRTYKELPLRLADFGVLHRNEASGALSGLTRVYRFQQDDAHIFCAIDQVESEMTQCIDFLQYVYGILNLELSLELSTRPETYLGELDVWEKAETVILMSIPPFFFT